MALAEELRSRAVGLAYSRATEFSPALPLCHVLAAQVALLVHGAGSERLRGFEADLAGGRSSARNADRRQEPVRRSPSPADRE